MIGHEIVGQWINHLWQSTVFVAVAAPVALAFRKNRAHVRYWVWFSASVKFLLPFAPLMNLGNSLWAALATRKIATALAPPAASLTVQQIAQPFPQTAPLARAASLAHTANWALIAILSIWLCGFLAVALIRFRSWLSVSAALRASMPIDIGAAIPVRSSPGLLEPGVVGILHPVLLMSEGILQHLSPSQLRAVVAHELCHIRRHDNLTAAIHMLVEAVFWFHPLVWWIGARLVEEREQACDEAVLSLGGEPRDYADAIVSVCKLYLESPLTCVSGISGADLKKRIVRIMARHVGHNMSLGRKLALAVAVLLTVAVPVVVGWAQVQAAVVPLLHPKDGVRRAFEVATIKLSLPTAAGWQIQLGLSPFRMTNASAYDLVRFAYGTTSDAQIVDAPAWLKTEHFDIQAKASDADVAAFYKLVGFDGRDRMIRLFTQSLLEDRFQLKATVETRDLPAYALVVDKAGIKMKETDPKLDPRLKGFGSREPNVYRAGDESMSSFVDWLSICYETGGRPVVDETGLKGKYDFVLSGVSQKPPPAGDPDPSTASLFTALSEQLGLKLVPVKTPMEVLVIDHIEQPSPN